MQSRCSSLLDGTDHELHSLETQTKYCIRQVTAWWGEQDPEIRQEEILIGATEPALKRLQIPIKWDYYNQSIDKRNSFVYYVSIPRLKHVVRDIYNSYSAGQG